MEIYVHQHLCPYKGKQNGRQWLGVLYRWGSLQTYPWLNAIQAVFAEASSRTFHLTPFKWIWKSPVTGCEQCVYDELYASDAWNEAQDKIMKQRRDDSCQLVIGLMFWSDSTHLTQFGHASAWPVYLFFRNLSKYAWANPQLGIVIWLHLSLQWGRFIFLMLVWRSHHFEQLPESIKQLQSSITNKKNNYDLLTLCKWDLFHAVWRTIFDDEFIEAYKNGIVIKCFDRVTSLRRVYSKNFTYLADYLEK